ncbi:MAG: dienelactone hydrolase family protein [Betaproteobacteria bacterium]|nr:dienelactone hydrolase family protein [Betaproteobacteria bacterium]
MPEPYARPSSRVPVLFKPAGDGPFPAAVLSHTCGGIYWHLYNWAERLTKAGYVVLIVDHLGPRGRKFNCPPDNNVSVSEYAEDAFEALAFLRSQPYVDGKRIVHIGFSYGAMAGLRIASAGFARRYLKQEPGFAAVVAFYPWCNEQAGLLRQDHMFNFYDDINTPLLVLLGAQDNEARPRSCVAQARSNAERGEPVEWKLYENATHAFDNASVGGNPATFQRGPYVYRGDASVVDEAWQDMKTFLNKRLAAQ